MKRLPPIVLLLVLALGCTVPVREPGGEAPDGSAAPGSGETDRELVPPGFGTLHQDQISVSLRDGPLLLRVTPLSEWVIRLTAPDTYERLHALAESRRPEARRATMQEEPELFLVSFFSYEPDVTFRPESPQVAQQGQVYRPMATLPITSGWGKQRLQQQEQQSAVYAFDPRLDLTLNFTVEYDLQRSDAWGGIISLLERERAKVRARAGS